MSERDAISNDGRLDSEAVREHLRVYFIMGSVNSRRPAAEVLTEAIAGGVTIFQFREKGPGALTGEAKVNLARELQGICRAHGVPFIVNDDIDLATRLDADGVHVGQDDEPARVLREKLGSRKIIGVSAHTPEEVRQAIDDGADYLGIGPVYPTSSKDDARPVQGTILIQNLRKEGITIPLVGIGGITAENASPVFAAGADGVSVISAIAGADHPQEAAAAFARLAAR
ncbi:thiamine phosphate synthase [Paenibacillus durus]|uniref:Thiamine-phosphate synthase n=1 Tax=Paenibacillus durus ATCC 35681 TaxID=1333534 RepID=A0A0F7F8D4_PAEDU|nr:thiamine phosphate synthase [Paenibacillus durus]AKG34583.1 thiamine-phosphate pyrophosphorylase [Paenibacillus durus ATCC 35681]